jgi:uncharacterized glyoxalase superfamily protein PhnB
MATIETHRKQAKQLVRWHRERNHSVGGKVRAVARFRELSDVEILAMPFPLTLAQEVVAAEAGFTDWAALKAAATPEPVPEPAESATLTGIVPILFVRDVTAAAAFYCDALGFTLDFLHGKPPFYGAVERDGVRLHLRHVAEPNFSALAAREPSLILATIEVSGIKHLFETYAAKGLDLPQQLVRQPWGGLDFQLRDPDGNILSFVEYRRTEPGSEPQSR